MGEEYPESKSALESKQDPPPRLFTPPPLSPDPRFRKFLRREASKEPTPCQDQRFGNWSPGSAGRSAWLCSWWAWRRDWAWSAPYLASGSGCLRHLLLRTAEPLPSAPSWRRVPGMLTLPVLAIISTWCLCVCIARRGN